MAQTFWTGSSLSFTNGSKIVTVNTGPSVDSIYPNSILKAGNYNEPVEVKAAYGNTIELFENWPGSTGNASATITPSAAAAAAAGAAAQQVISEIQSLVGSASATATANSFVKRDSNGRIKAATPSANDDVVTKGHIGTAATRDVGTSPGNVMEVGGFGLGGVATITDDFDSIDESGFYRNNSGSAIGTPFAGSLFNITHIKTSTNAATQLAIDSFDQTTAQRMFFRSKNAGNVWSDWQELYHSGNTNFTILGNGTSNIATVAFGLTGSTVVIFLRTAKAPNNVASSVTNIANFSVQSIDGGTTLGTNKVVELANSTGGLTTLTISGLTGVIKGEVYRVTGGQATINF